MIQRILELLGSRHISAINFEKEVGVYHGALSDWKKRR